MNNIMVTLSGWIIALLLGAPAAFYYGRRIFRERASEKQQNKEHIKEILQMVRNSMTYAEQYNKHGTRIPLADLSPDWFSVRPWVKQTVRNKLLKLQDLAADFELWLRLSKDLVTATMFQAAYYEGTFSEFTLKMDKTGRGKFSDLLLNDLQYPALAGQDITMPWLRDNISSLYAEIMKAGGEQEIKNVVEPVCQLAQSNCLQIMREKRQHFLEEAHHTMRYLEALTK